MILAVSRGRIRFSYCSVEKLQVSFALQKTFGKVAVVADGIEWDERDSHLHVMDISMLFP